MKSISGNIYNISTGKFIRGTIYFDSTIIEIREDLTIVENSYILPGFIDAHIHIESTMLNPYEYARESVKHGVISAIIDPHEIANVCGLDGIRYMQNCSFITPMKIYIGAPSCVPATEFETSGACISCTDIENLFRENICFHLAEMMNFPGVINNNDEVIQKLKIAKKYDRIIDGHAPKVTGEDLKKYIADGISTDHECTSVEEAIEKINLGMMILIRNSSASNDLEKLHSLIDRYPNDVMFCTDDYHPDNLVEGYLERIVSFAVSKNHGLSNIIKCSTINAINHYKLDIGLLRIKDHADFIVVEDLVHFKVLKTFINGDEVYNGEKTTFSAIVPDKVNNFYINRINVSDIRIEKKSIGKINVIEIIPDSLLTKHIQINPNMLNELHQNCPDQDILKVVVVNRYFESKPAIGFIKGLGIREGAIGSTVAHDSHNIIVAGVDDNSIIDLIMNLQQHKGGLALKRKDGIKTLALPVAGLMSECSASELATVYKMLVEEAKEMGTTLHSPFMTLAFMSLLVIPELKLGDKGYFSIDKYSFIPVQD